MSPLPLPVGALETRGEALVLEVARWLVYLAASGSGLRIIDVSNPAAPVEVGASDERFARALDIAGDTVFVATEQSGLWVVDASDPGRPATSHVFDTWGSADSVAVHGAHVYIADRAGGLIVLRSSAALAAVEQQNDDALAELPTPPEQRLSMRRP